MSKRILALIPAYNEEGSIKIVIKNIRNIVDGILVVDDGSSDNTAKYARECGVEVIRFHKNRGKGAAIREGYKYFLSSNYDVCIIYDADGQYRKEDILPVCKPIIEDEADIVVGSRFLGKYKEGANINYRIRILCNHMSTFVTRIMSGLPTTDAQSGLVAINRYAAEVLDLEADRWGIHQEIIIRAGKKGLRYKEVPIVFEKRLHGVSRLKVLKYPFVAFPVMLKAWLRK
ncbi:glycosyl transferase [Methanofervidicoccus sp. A16]|uniref:glycosyltransferase family 2 protein n=1 Tax=Methanofervidicoccus sp. A16 TaxID=2607662 RepID=UPI00118AA676|nr:glycosyltransferase family 2 protein [Methanofervidicoccus sp. A16]AXI24801.1 glycosyl transferase [Methanofervidicoccus sp. A16]